MQSFGKACTQLSNGNPGTKCSLVLLLGTAGKFRIKKWPTLVSNPGYGGSTCHEWALRKPKEAFHSRGLFMPCLCSKILRFHIKVCSPEGQCDVLAFLHLSDLPGCSAAFLTVSSERDVFRTYTSKMKTCGWCHLFICIPAFGLTPMYPTSISHNLCL